MEVSSVRDVSGYHARHGRDMMPGNALDWSSYWGYMVEVETHIVLLPLMFQGVPQLSQLSIQSRHLLVLF